MPLHDIAPGGLSAAKVSLTGGNITATSSSFADITGATLTITTGARRVLVTWIAVIENATAGNNISLDVAVDGTRQGGSNGLIFVEAQGNGVDMNFAGSYVTDVLSAGSHTIKLQWRSGGSTQLLAVASSTSPLVLSVVELPVSV